MHHTKSPLYRNSLFLMSSSGARVGLGFIFWVIVAKFYTEAEVGLGSAIISAIILLDLISRLGFRTALIRFLPKAEKATIMINSCLTLTGVIAIVVAVIFIAGLNLWSPALGFIRQNMIFSLTFILSVVFLTFSSVLDGVFIANRKVQFVFFRILIMLLIRLPLPVLLVPFFHAFGIAASWSIGLAVAVFISVFLFIPMVQRGYKPVPKINLKIMGKIWRYSIGNYVAVILNQAPTLILPIMVVNLLGAEQNGYFYMDWMIASLLFHISKAVSDSLFAEGAHFKDELRNNVIKSVKFTALLLLPVIALILLLGNWLLLYLGDGYFVNGLLLLRILSLSSVFIAINVIYGTILRIEDRIRELVFIYAFRTAVVLLASYFVATSAGIVGIGYVWLAAQGVTSIYAILAIITFSRRV